MLQIIVAKGRYLVKKIVEQTMQKYAINEIFQSIQGEGEFSGMPAIFIRLQGCEVGCAWCDTKHSWSLEPELELDFLQFKAKNSEAATWAWLEQNQLLQLLTERGYSAKLIVVTGGEPAAVDLLQLSTALLDAGYQLQLETSGTYPIAIDARAWVTVSPKVNMRSKKAIVNSALERANEIKHPVGRLSDIENLQQLLSTIDVAAKKISLQPISCKQSATELAIKYCIKYNWRLSVQLHKYLGVE